MKVHLTNIDIQWANKEGQPYLDKRLKPYARVGIQTQENGKRWLSGFAYQESPVLGWRMGQEVEIETEEKGQYLNFRLPKPLQATGGWNPQLVEKVFVEFAAIRTMLANLEPVEEKLEEPPTHSNEPDSENNPPF